VILEVPQSLDAQVGFLTQLITEIVYGFGQKAGSKISHYKIGSNPLDTVVWAKGRKRMHGTFSRLHVLTPPQAFRRFFGELDNRRDKKQ